MKKIVLLFFLLLISLSVCAYGCENGDNGSKVDPTATLTVDFSDGCVYEFRSDVTVPTGLIKDKDGNVIDGEITYKFTKPDNSVISSAFPEIFCDKVGQWKVEYIYGKETKTFSFTVTDTTAPEVYIGALPGDVYVSETAVYTLPSINADDYSGIDWDKTRENVKLYLNDEEVAINIDSSEFKATEPGEFRFQVQVFDIYGNSKTEIMKWNSKVDDWTPDTLEEGYLASYDQKEYINSVRSGNFSNYWNAVPYEEYFEEYEGAKGVVKVSSKANGYGCAGFKFNLFETLNEGELQGKNVIIKLLTTSSVTELTFGSMKWIEEYDGNLIQCCENFNFPVIKDQWNYLVLSESDLARCNYFNEGGDGTENGKGFNAFQIGFGAALTNPLTTPAELYIDYVVIGEMISDVKNFALDGNLLTWDAVIGASEYEVTEGNNKTTVKTNGYTIKDLSDQVYVRAIADSENVFLISSDRAVPFVDISDLEEGYIAGFTNSKYETLVDVSKNPNRKASSITAEYLESYKGESGVLKVTSVNNDIFGDGKGIGDIVLYLPKACSGKLTVKFLPEKVTGTEIRFIQPETEWGFDYTDFTSGNEWKTQYLNYNNQYEKSIFDRIEIMLQGGNAGETNVIYFSFVYDGRLKEEESGTETVPETYLLDLDDYTVIANDGDREAIVSTSVVENYRGQKKALKVVTTNNGTNYAGDFLLKLDKETSGEITVKLLVENFDGNGITFVDHGDDGKKTVKTISTSVDGWQVLCINVSKTEYLEIKIDGKGVSDNVVYFALVMAGDQTDNGAVTGETDPTVEDKTWDN